jgi:hypothetical protein
MKKKLYILGFMFAMISNQSFAFDEISLFSETSEKSKWMVLEKKFITNIHKSKKTTWSHVSSVIPAVTAIFAGYQYCNLDSVNSDNDILLNLRKPVNVYPMLGIVATTILASEYLDCYLSSKNNRTAVKDFFANWEENQYYIPSELEEAFDILADVIEFEGEEAVLAHANEIVEAIQFLVTRNFESRYKNSLDAKARDAMSDTKTVIESFKNFFDGAKHLSGLGK